MRDSAGGQPGAKAPGSKAVPGSQQGVERELPADPEAAAAERRQKERGIGVTSAFRNILIISKRDPENIPEYSEFLYLCGNHWV